MENQKLYIAWVMIFIVSIPLAFNLVPPNGFWGFRIWLTLTNPETWRRGNIFSGWVFMAASVIGGAITRFFPEVAERWGSLLLVYILFIGMIVSVVYVMLIS